jgi:hypothetical protein
VVIIPARAAATYHRADCRYPYAPIRDHDNVLCIRRACLVAYRTRPCGFDVCERQILVVGITFAPAQRSPLLTSCHLLDGAHTTKKGFRGPDRATEPNTVGPRVAVWPYRLLPDVLARDRGLAIVSAAGNDG